MSHPSTSNPAVVQVAIASPLYRLFDYLPVAGGSIKCHPLGSRVLVPFGKREVVGIVAGHQSQSALAIAQLKCVIKPLGSRAALEPPQLKLAHWLADYYHHPLGDVLFNMLPNALRKPVIWPRNANNVKTSLFSDRPKIRTIRIVVQNAVLVRWKTVKKTGPHSWA